MERLIAQAKQDLAGRTGVAVGDVIVVGTTAETWKDTSLGCPEPGKAYAQVLTEGYRIELESNGKRYEYHTDMTRVVLCSDPA